MDSTDVQIMNLLKINARTPVDQLAAELGIESTELAARMDNLEKAGYIKGYYTDIDLEKIGYRIKAFIMISVLPEDQRKFYDFIQKEDSILECSHITGPFSMLLKVVFPSTADLDTFIGQLQEFGKTETQVVFSTVLERH
ncbi:MAG: Lrp/AsnC family transcriptional regulator, partial [Firmicutes bacterium]|nr:Lrp/AsnC family transcriptional regulator [Bacillota bacterium]